MHTSFRKFALTALLFLTTTHSSFAQQKQITDSTLAISPAIIEIAGTPGSQVKSQVTLFNVTTKPVAVRSYIQKFTPKEEIKPEQSATFDASSWITIPDRNFILQAKDFKTTDIEINIPEDAEPGGHYATLYFEPLVEYHVLEGSNARVGSRLGVLIFITVAGEIKKSLEIHSIEKVPLTPDGPEEIKVNLRNNGNVHLIPDMTLKVYSYLGKELYNQKLQSTIVLPQTEKIVSIPISKAKKFWPGVYRAEVTLQAPRDQTITGRFTVFPWKEIVLIFTSLTLLLGVLIMKGDKLLLAVRIILKGETAYRNSK